MIVQGLYFDSFHIPVGSVSMEPAPEDMTRRAEVTRAIMLFLCFIQPYFGALPPSSTLKHHYEYQQEKKVCIISFN